jgi:hypothetical protein
MTHTHSSRLPALAFGLAGVLFVLYPVIRPFSDEKSLQGAAAFASSSWVLAHTLAIAAFVLLLLGMLGLYQHLRETPAGTAALRALVLSWIGVGLTLPYYGAETFGLNAIGKEALRRQDPDLVLLSDEVRFGSGGVLFIAGLILLAVGAALVATALWKSAMFPQWSGLPLAVGFALYLPQFSTPQSVRIAHGLLVTIACLLLAWGLLRQRSR